MPNSKACKVMAAGTAVAGSLAFTVTPGVPRSLAPRGATTTGAKTSKERPERPTRDDRGAVFDHPCQADGFAAPALAAALGASACAAARRQTRGAKTSKPRRDGEGRRAGGDLSSIFNSIREAAKVISKLVNTAPLKQAELLGLQGEINVQGEDQKKLDVITNDVFKNALRYTGKMGTLASEEEDEPVDGARAGESSEVIPVLSEEFADTGKYICVFDPLDGSSNVDAGIPVGTIFGVFQEPDPAECELPDDLSKGLSEDQQRQKS
eukprot:g9548.t1